MGGQRSKNGELTSREERFVAEYLKDLNATQAAIRAGYSQSVASAEVQGCLLLGKSRVASAIAREKGKQLRAAGLSATRVLEELRRIAFQDPADFLDEDGNPLPIRSIPPEARAAISSVEMVLKNAKAGDNVVDRVLKIKTWNKNHAAEVLAKHFKLLTDVIQDERATADLLARLDRGRERNRTRDEE